jgi:hypothetical protein
MMDMEQVTEILVYFDCLTPMAAWGFFLNDVAFETSEHISVYVISKKLSHYRPEQVHGRSGRLRLWIFLTFGTRGR